MHPSQSQSGNNSVDAVDPGEPVDAVRGAPWGAIRQALADMLDEQASDDYRVSAAVRTSGEQRTRWLWRVAGRLVHQQRHGTVDDSKNR